jgi:sugar phosphate permease
VSAIDFRLKNYQVIVASTIVAAIFGRLVFSISSSIAVICLALMLRGFAIQVGNMANQMQWVEKTNAENRAGMFGLRRMFGQGSFPVISILFAAIIYFGGESLIQTNALTYAFFIAGALEILVAIFFYYRLDQQKPVFADTPIPDLDKRMDSGN